MAKRRQNRKRKQQAPQQKPQQAPARRAAVVPRVNMLTMLDAGARAWAKLLDDPCAANLVYPCYPTGTGGSVLMRFETDNLYYTGATETAGMFLVCPGALQGFTNNVPQTSDTAPGSPLGAFLTQVPGYSFIHANANSFRAVAGCMQIMYPGTELNRSGIVGVGITDGAVFSRNIATANGGGNINLSAGELRTMCQHVERMPTGVVEIKWFPGNKDQQPESTQGNDLNSTDEIGGRNTMFASVSGFPVSTGVRIRTVCVYEISFGAGAGQVTGAHAPPSINTPAQVVKAMSTRDPLWYIESAVKAGKAIGTAISYAAAGYKAASSIAAGLALV